MGIVERGVVLVKVEESYAVEVEDENDDIVTKVVEFYFNDIDKILLLWK